MKNLLVLIIFSLMFFVSENNAQTVHHPFPNHTAYTSSHIKPNNYTQDQLDAHTKSFYDLWKVEYLNNSCGNGEYYVDFGGSNGYITVSEAHGYGMMITVLMAGYDSNAKKYFDGLCKYYDKHRSSINGGLMSWQQGSCSDATRNDDAATDGDIDIAYALLLADRQWGSGGNINYLQKALTIIQAIKDDEVNDNGWFVKLGDWQSNSSYATRTSDFIMDHFRAFNDATNDDDWLNVVDKCYDLIDSMQTNYSSTTGLLPDFIIDVNSIPKPAAPNFLEGNDDGYYYYNACRDPWRIASDYLLFGTLKAKNAVTKINTWLKTDCSYNPNNIVDGYELDGTHIESYRDPAFTAPFAVGAMLDDTAQTWLNALYLVVKNSSFSGNGYYENTIKMLSMIVISGNYWSPTQYLSGIGQNVIENENLFYLTSSGNDIVINFSKDCFNDKLFFKLIDVSGKVVLEQNITEKSNYRINKNSYSKGLYILKVYSANESKWSSEKIIF